MDVAAPGSVEDEALAAVQRSELRRAIAELPPRMRTVVVLRYGLLDEDPCSCREVARRIGHTHPTVRVVERDAIQRLRGLMRHPRDI